MLTRLRSDEGFTLIELLAAITIGMIVLLAAFDLMDNSLAVSGQVSARTEASQRGRGAIDQMTRAVRSQVCVNGNAPVSSADDDQVTFTFDLSNGSTLPKRTQLSYDPSTRSITQSTWNGSGAEPTLTFPGPPSVNTVLTDVDPEASKPIFAYWALRPGSGGTQFDPLDAAAATADPTRIARIDIAFVAHASGQVEKPENASTIEDSVFVRSVDPNTTSSQVLCP
ncbi:MAG TPA: prepilin-type N-terminal cleavage/methylation domain-containing protein [Solirubrobacteraceae bacterium]